MRAAINKTANIKFSNVNVTYFRTDKKELAKTITLVPERVNSRLQKLPPVHLISTILQFLISAF